MRTFWRTKVHCLSPKTTICLDNFNIPHPMPMEAAAPTPIVSALRTLRAHANVTPSLWRFRSENGSPQWISVLHCWPDSNSYHFPTKACNALALYDPILKQKLLSQQSPMRTCTASVIIIAATRRQPGMTPERVLHGDDTTFHPLTRWVAYRLG